MAIIRQASFSKGEISPDLYGRTDLAMYTTALKTARNAVVHQNGGVSNRSGTIIRAPVKDHTYTPRLIPFEFKTTDKYVLEFGDQYMRVMRDGAHVLDSTVVISNITNASPAVVTATAHGFSSGDEVYITGTEGMLRVEGNRYIIDVLTADTFALYDQRNGTAPLDSTNFGVYTGSGSASTIYEISTPYSVNDLMEIKFVQTADTMTLTHASYPVYELTRTGHAAWTLAAATFTPLTTWPTSVSVSTQSTVGNFRARYKVTAVGDDESLPGVDTTNAKTITAITRANPAVVTSVGHGLATDDEVHIASVVGMTELNGRRFTITKIDADTFSLRDENSTDYAAYASAGTATPTYCEIKLNNITGATQANPCVLTVAAGHGVVANELVQIAGVVGMVELNNKSFVVSAATGTTITLSNVNSTGFTAYTSGGSVWKQNTSYSSISWNAVAGAVAYRVYKEKQGVYGFVGETPGLTFVENNIAPDVLDTPPAYRNPFFGSGNYPGTVSFYEQRRVFGGSTNAPDTSEFSRPGAPSNMTTTRPSQDDDAISAALSSLQVNEIRHYVPMNDLLAFTSGGEWKISSGPDSRFAPTTIKQKEQTRYGCNHLRPLSAGANVVFCEDSGAMVRSVGYTYQSDQYTAGDLSVLSSHLLHDYELVDWCWAGSPDNRVYAVRDDGVLLTLVYDEEQSVVGWTRWELANEWAFERAVSLRKGTGEYHDEVYFIVNVGAGTTGERYIVQLADPEVLDCRDAKYLDLMVSYDVPLDIQNITLADPVVLGVVGHGLSDGDEVDVSSITWVPTTDALGNETQPAQLNGGRYTVANSTTDTFELDGVDGTAFSAWIRGGVVRKAVSTIYGMAHLYGRQITALVDGAVQRDLTVQYGGKLVLNDPASRVHVGLSYSADIETLNVEKGDGLGGLPKKANSVTIQVANSRGLWYGPDSDTLDELKQRTDEAYGEPTRLYTESYNVKLPPVWQSNGRIFLRQLDPLPLNVVSITPDWSLGKSPATG
jgi:hypothetical protein